MTTSKKSAAEQLVESATEAGLVTEETTVPAQSGKKDKVTVGEGIGLDGQTKTIIHLGEEDDGDVVFDGAKVQKSLTDLLEEGVIAHVSLVDGEIVIDTVPAGKVKKLVSGVKTKVKKNKKAMIAGGVAVLAIALGVTVQKKRTGTDEESEPEAVEPATEA